MGLRSRIKARIHELIDRFSGEYSSASEQVPLQDEWSSAAAGADAEVKVVRARLRRPRNERA